ncbi:MAG: hypothetical protein RIR86_1751 [Acidobacteriota bacterium]
MFATILVLAALFGSVEGGGAAPKPHVVFVAGDNEYGSEETFPLLAAELRKNYGVRVTVLKSEPDENSEENIPGLEALETADLAVLYLRWRRLPKEQLDHLRRYLESGRPVVAFRTTTHAFNYPAGHELERWNAMAVDYLGGPPGWGRGHYHYGHRSSTVVSVAPGAEGDPLLRGVENRFAAASWLYHVLPNYPPREARILLMGQAVNPEKPGAIDNPVAWTWKNRAGGRVFMTTLGHPADFDLESFQRLVVNGIHWALGSQGTAKWRGPFPMNVQYHGFRKR